MGRMIRIVKERFHDVERKNLLAEFSNKSSLNTVSSIELVTV